METMRKNTSKLAMIFAIGLAATSAPYVHAQVNSQSELTEHTDINQESVNKVLNYYLEIKEALVQTNGEDASNSAKKLVRILGDKKGELAKKIRLDAEHISETNDVGHQRDHFNSLSENIYTLIKATRANEGKLYWQFCPMAMDNKGAYWLSDEKQVKNPYFGDKMLHCGRVKEEI